jgi:hypothetical protein
MKNMSWQMLLLNLNFSDFILQHLGSLSVCSNGPLWRISLQLKQVPEGRKFGNKNKSKKTKPCRGDIFSTRLEFHLGK